MKNRWIALLLALALLILCAAPALAVAPKVKDTDYEGGGVVKVEFASGRVQYRNLKVAVKDAAGNRLAARILEKDDDDLSFKVTGVKAGAKYTYTVSGVRAGKTGSFGSVKGSFRAPADAPEIRKVEYDPRDRELEVEFATRVQYKSLKVTVKDANGNALTVRKIRKDRDEVEMKVKGLEPGKRYTVTVSGVRVKGKGSYISVTKDFTA